jgi:hypothetical protein
MKRELTTDIEELRAKFETLARDTWGFKRSRKGNYVNPVVARDWKWFRLGHAAALHPAAAQGEGCG